MKSNHLNSITNCFYIYVAENEDGQGDFQEEESLGNINMNNDNKNFLILNIVGKFRFQSAGRRSE